MTKPNEEVGPDYRRWMAVLLVAGLALRLAAAWMSAGIVAPDEHQQYVEQGFRVLHGYGATYWEQDYGMRHPLFSFVLAGILWIGEQLGIENPHLLAFLQRLVLCLGCYAAFATLAFNLLSRGQHVAGLALVILLVCCVDLVFVQVRVLSENACMALLALVLALWGRKPLWVGILLGLMLAFRLQAAPIVAGLWAIALWHDMRAAPNLPSRYGLWRLSLGLAVSVLFVGWLDWLYHGEWFHSVFANLQKNVLEKGASNWQTSPWHRYLLHAPLSMLRVSLFSLPLLVWGAWRRPGLAVIVVLFIGAHSIIPHKERRYLWPLIPLVCLLLVTAFADLHARGYLRSRAILTCLVGSLVLPSIVRCWFVEWNTELYAASCHGLAVIGKQDDVRGVVLIDLPRYLAGNYFYLRHPAPIRYLSSAAADGLALERDWQEGRLNYLVAPQGRLSATLRDRLEPIGSWRHWEYYRLRGSKLSLTGETALISRDSTVAPAGPFSETSTRPPHNR